MKIVVGIPARMGSTRFPGKPLCDILGKPMIEHVYKRSALAKSVTDVFIAACDEEIKAAVESFGGKVLMTPKEISRPGLRVAEACKQLDLADDDIVVVVQGDEPLVHPEMIERAVAPLLQDQSIFCVNLAKDMTEEEWLDPNEIHVVTDAKMNALYMSRSPLPSNTRNRVGPRIKQVCIMPFTKKNLFAFQEMSATPLEVAESIEMLRAIEHGFTVRMVKTDFNSKSVDNENDRQQVEKIMINDEIYKQFLF
ncbi:MAG: 3-deoxy-manno-octulosonate cytidylyltransferase [Parcubacteria group bacterium]